MGIENFSVYAQKAFNRPPCMYKNSGNDTSQVVQNKHGRAEYVGFIDDVLRLAGTSMGLENHFFWKPAHTGNKIVQGVCVDLSSFSYSTIHKVVEANLNTVRYRRSPSPVPDDILNASSSQPETTSETDIKHEGIAAKLAKAFGRNNLAAAFDTEKKNNDIFSGLESQAKAVANFAPLAAEEGGGPNDKHSDCTATTARNTSRKRKHSGGDELELPETTGKENTNKKRGPQLKDSIVEVDLPYSLVQICASACLEHLLAVVGRDTIANAHYFFLHFDENTTSCKWYEQYKRICSNNFRLSNESRKRVFIETLRMVKEHLLADTEKRLTHEFRTRPSRRDEPFHDEDVLRLLTNDGFLNKVVFEKMGLLRNVHTNDIRAQRYSSGEGEWKCFYSIRDVENEPSPFHAETAPVHHQWFVFGNDGDIGLGVILHTTASSEILYVNTSKRVLSVPMDIMSDRPHAFKALHFLALSLIGNDYVPRLVNSSLSNLTALATEVDRMIKSEETFCRKYVEEWARVFQEPNRRDEEAAADKRWDSTDRSNFALAIAYICARLLKAVYNKTNRGDECGNTRCVENCFARFFGLEGAQVSRTIDKTKSIACEDGVNRSFFDCFKPYVACTLWYAAYCMFYTNMSPSQQSNFQRLVQTSDHELIVKGLPMRKHYRYNERRLHQHVQFRISKIRDVQCAIKNLTTDTLIATIEKCTIDVLEE